MNNALGLLLLLACVSVAICSLSVNVNKTTGNYEVMVDGANFLDGAGAAVHLSKTWYKSADGSLKLKSVTEGKGSDKLGDFDRTTMVWDASGTPYITEFQVYKDSEIVKCVQSLPMGGSDTSVGDSNDVMASFPTFKATSSLNYFTYHGTMAPAHVGHLTNNPNGIRNQAGGPVMVYNEKLRNLIMSPFDNFMSGGSTISKQLDGVFAHGPLGTVNVIPAKFTYTTIIVGGTGVNDNFYAWGDALLKSYGKQRTTDDADVLIQYLGYWTDNGAYYYYLTEPGKNYEDTMIDVYDYITKIGVPVKNYQFDSWWYFKGNGDGVTLWEPTPKIFPNGMKYLDEHMGNMPLALHNRYFATDNEYKKNFSMLCEPKTCLPTGEDLYLYIMGKAKGWGMVLYEQDWLVTSFVDMESTQNNTFFARNWMMNMGNAAKKLDITVQYCMPLPRHILQSVELQSVTQARASGDYNPGNTNWLVGPTSMFYWAVGIKPFKDDFWTSPDQSGCKYGGGKDCNEPNTEMIVTIATMTTGPVGPSDKIGMMNKTLVMGSCNADGLLLKPDKPMTTMDKVFQMNFDNPQLLNLWSSFSTQNGLTWSYAIGIGLPADESIFPGDLGLTDGTYYAYDFWGTRTIAKFDKNTPLVFPKQTSSGKKKDFKYFVISNMQQTNSDWVFMGELDKYASVSSQRFQKVSYSGSALSGAVVGVANEIVNLTALKSGATQSFSCTLDSKGTASFTCDNTCKCA